MLIRSLTIIILGFSFSYEGCRNRENSPDLIIYNADVYTLDPAMPWASAIAVRDGRILGCDTTGELLDSRDSSTHVIDAQGAFVMPGFIEGHGHLPGLGSSLQNLNFLNTRSWDEVVDAVARKAAATPPGEWIVGRGWHQEKWADIPQHSVQGYPYHYDLSRVSPDNPVLLKHASGHALFANKAAMDLAGVNQETPDPAGGHIVRGDGDEAIGVFEENAQQVINDVYQTYLTTQSSEQILRQWYEGIHLAQAECLKKGVTSFQDAGSSLEEIRRCAEMAAKGELGMRVWMMMRHTPEFLEGNLDDFPLIGVGNGFFTCRAAKASIDGALGSYGAWMLTPYDDNPGFIGQNTTSLDEIRKIAELCASHGLQCCVHAIGDRANREVLDLYERIFAQHQLSGDVRWRIEHAQHLDPADIPRFGALGVVASMQGIHCTSDAPFVVRRLGEERAEGGAYPWRSILDSGGVIGNGTDTPVEDVDPIRSFYATVTRKRVDTGQVFYSDQKLTRAEAIYSYTMANAYAAFEESEKGSLETGKYADLVFLDKNLITCTESEILETRVLMTIVHGEIKYRFRDD